MSRASWWPASGMLAILMLASGAASSAAEPALCGQLEAELAALGSVDQLALRKYDRAVAVQRQELLKGKAGVSGAGCAGPKAAAGRRCAALSAAVSRMEDNLAALLDRQQAIAAGEDSERHRDHLIAALDAGGCNEAAITEPPAGGTGQDAAAGATDGDLALTEARPDDDQATAMPPGAAPTHIVIVPGLTSMDGLYRTACVRTCDGYYFPLSPASTPADFPRDRASCDAQCPGSEVEMYYQKEGIDDPATMLSTASGAPYSALPAAFSYRKPGLARPPDCGCNGTRGSASILGGTRAPLMRLPETDPAAPAVPSTRSGSIVTFGAPAPASTAAPSVLPPPGERKVRVVGPTFLPDPQGAIDSPVPAPKSGL